MSAAARSSDPWLGAELGGRFRIVRRLGSGGFGTVYEAHDARRDATIALKILERYTPMAIAQLKREFRELADLTHPNLVRLDELHLEGETYFFTMERVLGIDLRRWVGADEDTQGATHVARHDAAPTRALADVARDADEAPAPSRAIRYDAVRLRSALVQMVRGLDHLHRHGKLHCDVKPSNVVIELETGRAVLVDFGLVTESERPDVMQSGAGTPRFMSPEMISGETLGPASDVYSLGVTLYEILTGTSPFDGTTAQLLAQKVFATAPAVRLRAPDAPTDLAALCDSMLARAPADRPGADAILAALGAVDGSASDRRALPFVGRERELASLVAVADRARIAQRVAVVRVSGQSGIGKTRLVREACDAIAIASPGALVLRARCLEQEWLPFKALDPLMERLIAELASSSPEVRAELATDDELRALGEIFSLARELVPAATPRSSSPIDRRRAAADALRSVLARVASRRSLLVLAIDDAQWGDEDSARMIADALHGARLPIVLFVSSRAAEPGPFTSTLANALRGALVDSVELEVAPLARAHARRIALELAPDAVIDRVLDAAEGNPFLLTEAARASRSGAALGDADTLLRARVRTLDDASRASIETLAVAGRPLARPLLESVAGIRGDTAIAAIATLRANRLATTWAGGVREDPREEWIESAHDRVREAVYAGLEPERRTAIHGALAAAIEASSYADPDALAFHCERAGRVGDAIHYAESAGDAAMRALAFGRAAASYTRALALEPTEATTRARLLEALGDAHERAGHAVRAAEALDRAAELAHSLGAPGRAHVLELRRRAATLLLQAGHVEDGMRGIEAVLAEVGLSLPRARPVLLGKMVLGRARLELGGLRFTARDAAQIPEQELLRIDVCGSVASGMSLIDTAAGSYFSGLHLRFALEAGEPVRIARAIGSEVAYRAGSGGVGRSPREARVLELARELALQSGDPIAIARLPFVIGTAAFLHAEWEDARRDLELAADEMRAAAQGLSHEIVTAEHFVLASLGWLGRWRELVQRLPSVLAHARDVGDLYAETTVATAVGHYPGLAADEPDAARAVLTDGMARWSRDGFFIQHYDTMIAETDVDLYVGRAPDALARIESRWPALERSLLRHVQTIRIESEHARARAWVATGHGSKARAAGARLVRERLPWAIGLGELVLGSCERDPAHAIARLDRAIAALDDAGTTLIAAAARWRRAELAEDPRALADARALFEAQGVRAPERIVGMIAPQLPR